MTEISRKAKEFNSNRPSFNKKMCSVCGDVKSSEEFTSRKTQSDGKNTNCKECKNTKARNPSKRVHTKNQLIAREYNKNRPNHFTKCCSDCAKISSIDDFNRDSTSKDGHVTRCRICSTSVMREYENSDRGKSNLESYKLTPNYKVKIYKNNNRPGAKEYRSAYYSIPENKAKILKSTKESYEKRWSTPEGRRKILNSRRKTRQKPESILANTYREALRSAIRPIGIRRSEERSEMLGYTKEEFRDHLNKGKYTWSDYLRGGFHVDHIIPMAKWVAKAILLPEEEAYELMKKANSLRNLRVWPATENLIKHDAIDLPLIKKHNLQDLYELVKE